MIEFVAGCSGLFTSTFNAVVEQEFFRLLVIYLVVYLGFGLFYMAKRGLRKM